MMKGNTQFLIMIVEDDQGILENLKLLLGFNNFSVITAGNGREAIDKLKKMHESLTFHDLILSDIVMPKIDGYTFFKIISNFSPWNRIPFIFLSALSYPDDIRLAKSLGVDDYITKPFKEEDLLTAINSKLNNSKNNREFTIEIGGNSLKGLDLIKYFKNKASILFHLSFTEEEFKIENLYPYSKEATEIVHLFNTEVLNKHFRLSLVNPHSPTLLFTNIQNTEIQSIILFDKFDDAKSKQHMLGFISKNLSYFDLLNIKKTFQSITNYIHLEHQWNIEHFWKIMNNSLNIKSEGLEKSIMDNYLNLKPI